MGKRNLGILTSMSWNSNQWAAPATSEDIKHSNFDYVKENGWMHEDLNFGHELLPCEEDGNYIAYTPMFNTLPSLEESSYVEIVFFRSLNYHAKQNCIVGFYAFPKIEPIDRNATHKLYKQYDWGNVASFYKDIVLFKTPIVVSDEILLRENYVPKGKKLGKMGFNYLKYENVIRLLDKATMLNPDEGNLKRIKYIFLTEAKFKL